MRKILYLFGLCFFMASNTALAAFTEPNMADYTALPIFSAQAVQPNIMIVLDTGCKTKGCCQNSKKKT